MPLHPPEYDRVITSEIYYLGDQWLPEIPVSDKIALGIPPAAPTPTLPPTVPKTVHDVGGVANDLYPAWDRSEGLEDRGELHALVRRLGLSPARVVVGSVSPAPATWAGIAEAGAIGVDDRGRCLGHIAPSGRVVDLVFDLRGEESPIVSHAHALTIGRAMVSSLVARTQALGELPTMPVITRD